MIDAENLIEGNFYFLISYFDDALSIPDIETYIYVGQNLLPSDKGSEIYHWYFQDPETYIEKGAFIESQNKKEIDTLRADQDTLETMYDIEGLISELSKLRSK